LVNDLRELLQSALKQQEGAEASTPVRHHEDVLAAQPERWEELYLFGTALLQSRRFPEAIEIFRQLAHVRPDHPDVHNNLGVAYQALGEYDRASRAYREAIGLRSDYDRACLNLGRLKEHQGALAEAEQWYRRGAELKPGVRTHWLHLAGALGKQSKWAEAERVLRQTVDVEPENLDLWVNLAYALIQRERLEEAAAIYQRVLAQRPAYHEVHSNLAFVRERQGRFDEALSATRCAIELRPDYPEAYNNLGIVLRSLHHLDEACEAFRKAVALRADFPLAEFNLGTTRLLAGDYVGGWPGYRYAWRIVEEVPPARNLPEWNGVPIPGKNLHVYADQGFGDTIQFARFLSACRERSAAQIVFSCQPALVALFADLPGVDAILASDEPVPDCDFQVPLASLPGLLGVRIQSVGIGVPYLSSPRKLRPEIAALFKQDDHNAVRIGLVWQGNPKQTRDIVRSCPLEKLEPLLYRNRARFYSLQTGEPGRLQIDNLELTHRLTDVGGALGNFTDTAAVLNQLDLVITVDTATTHLAGALGRPVWTLLCHTPDWRWHLNRSDSPWYPTMRLFRQPRYGDWDSVVTAVDDSLKTCLLSEKKNFAK
jgi:Flp pilus assembly protein TadD